MSSPKPIIAVVGATGGQGSSVVSAFLKDPSYSIRALTRNPNSATALALADQGVEVVKADVNDYDSLVAAFEDVTAIYAITDFFEPFSQHGAQKATEIETSQGINLAKAASATPTLKHYIWSTLANASRISGGKYNIPHFVAKNNVDGYIKSDKALLAKTTFLWNTYYVENFKWPIFTPVLIESTGKYVQFSPVSDHNTNVGIFAHAIITHPQLTLGGKFVLATAGTTTSGELLKQWGEVKGKQAAYVKISLENFDKLWPGWGKEMGDMMAFWEDAGAKSWSGKEGVVTAKELGVFDELVSIKEALETSKVI